MLRALTIAACILAAATPLARAGEERPEVPAWLLARLDVEDPSELTGVSLVRTVMEGGVAATYEVPLSELPEDDPFGGGTTVAPAVPEVLVGELSLHFMIQVGRCDGYGAEGIGAGLALVQDASWDLGAHVAAGPLAGGAAAETRGDPLANLIVMGHTDRGMELAAGELAIREDRLTLFGQCFALLGQMTGAGAWSFS